MRYLITIVLLIIVLAGCSAQVSETSASESQVEEPDVSEEKTQKPSAFTDVVETCNSLCEVDDVAYCEEKRTITINGVGVTGTCRAFAKNGVGDVERCEGFCKYYPKSGTVCEVNGKKDNNCDGIV
jgi:hypothetical protein